MQRITKDNFINAIQHLTCILGEKPKIKDLADYLNEQNNEIHFSSNNVAYYIRVYGCDDCILKNDYIRLDITKETFEEMIYKVTSKLGKKPKIVDVMKAYDNDRVTSYTIRFYMKKFGFEDKFDYRPYKK